MSHNNSTSQLLKSIVAQANKHPKKTLFIPTALGGTFQLFELWRIGFPYTRFFSVSQIIADGLLACIVLLLLFIVSLILSFLLPKLQKWKSSFQATGRRKTFYSMLINVVLVLLVSVLTVIILFLFSNYSWQIILKIGGILCVTILGSLVCSYISNWLYDKITPKKVEPTTTAQINYITLPIFCFLILVALFSVTRPLFQLPDDLKNTELIHSIADKAYPNNKNNTIIYYNDKYIFMQIFDKRNKEQIEIFELEDLFKRSE